MPNALSRRKVATAFERELAKDLDARRVFLSGAGLEKADVRKRAGFTLQDGVPRRTDDLTYRVEAKTTTKPYYTFTQLSWSDLAKAADGAGEHPIFAIRFQRPRSTRVIVRHGLARELGILIPSEVRSMSRSCRLLPTTRTTLDFATGTRYERLWVLDYPSFLERLRAHGEDRRD